MWSLLYCPRNIIFAILEVSFVKLKQKKLCTLFKYAVLFTILAKKGPLWNVHPVPQLFSLDMSEIYNLLVAEGPSSASIANREFPFTA